jgi:hypothetical protein
MSIAATPADAPYPVIDYLKPSAQERSDGLLANCDTATDLPCHIPVQVGLFFDGTNNNMERDRDGKRVPVPWTKDELKQAKNEARKAGKNPDEVSAPPKMPDVPMTQTSRSHSNVARLFEAYPWDKQAQGYYPFYIQGVGTSFPKIGEETESQEGKAFAKGGLPRIVWGIFQVLNSIHMTLYEDQPLYKDEDVGKLAQAYCDEVGQMQSSGPRESHPLTHEEWFEPHIAKLKAALDAKPKPHIPSVTIHVFGFSRGAAESVAFCHRLNRLLDGGKLAGIPTDVQFLGLFDVVASVGGSSSVSRTMPLPDAIFDGHWDWANDVDEDLPGCVRKCLHLIAAHEQRMNFPLTQIGGAQEVMLPGVHSDIGGGYGPGEQGRSLGKQSLLLSQIPLALMYKAALTAGVPLVPFSKLQERDQSDFEIDLELAKAWEAYTAALGKDGRKLKKHMELYYRWRAARLTTLEKTASYQSASPQSKNDLLEANKMLAGDLEAMRFRRDAPPVFPGDEVKAPYGAADESRMNQWHRIRANSRTPLDSWEQFALPFFEKPNPLSPEVEDFFDNYVHDSFAGFYYAGAVTEFDKRVSVASVMKKKPEDRNKFETKVADVTQRANEAKRKQEAGDPLSEDEEALLKESQYGTPYPVMTDSDADEMTSGKEKFVFIQTDSRREGGGYIIRRSYYPKEGFFFRKSKSEDELEEAPEAQNLTPAQEKMAEAKAEAEAEKAPREMVWSDHLRRDIRAERMADAEETAEA